MAVDENPWIIYNELPQGLEGQCRINMVNKRVRIMSHILDYIELDVHELSWLNSTGKGHKQLGR